MLKIVVQRHHHMVQDGIGDSMTLRKQKAQKKKSGVFFRGQEIKLRNELKSLLKIIRKNPRNKMPSDFLLLKIGCLSIYFRTKMMAMLFLFDEMKLYPLISMIQLNVLVRTQLLKKTLKLFQNF